MIDYLTSPTHRVIYNVKGNVLLSKNFKAESLAELHLWLQLPILFYRYFHGWQKSIRKRQREGIDVALQNGIVFGRPKMTVTEEFKEAYARWKSKEITAESNARYWSQKDNFL